MQTGYLPHDGEAQAAAAGCGVTATIEAVEHALALIGGNTRTRVLHDQLHSCVAWLHRNMHTSARRRVTNRVIDQIGQQDPQRIFLAEYPRGSVGIDIEHDRFLRSQAVAAHRPRR